MELFVITATNVEFNSVGIVGVIDSLDKLDNYLHEYYGPILSERVTLTKTGDDWENNVLYVVKDEFTYVEIEVEKFILNIPSSD